MGMLQTMERCSGRFPLDARARGTADVVRRLTRVPLEPSEHGQSGRIDHGLTVTPVLIKPVNGCLGVHFMVGFDLDVSRAEVVCGVFE
jgi:hypothetical protein